MQNIVKGEGELVIQSQIAGRPLRSADFRGCAGYVSKSSLSGGAPFVRIRAMLTQGITELSEMYPVFVIVREDENGSSGSAGLEIVTAMRGIKVAEAAILPIRVAAAKTMAIGKIRFGFLSKSSEQHNLLCRNRTVG